MSEYNVDYSVIKKPGQDSDLTKEQAERWIELANDPFKFMTEECWVIGPFGKQLFEPRDYQIDLLDIVIDNNLCVVNSPRQSGKTQTMALYLLHQSIFRPDFNIGVTSYRLSGCKDIMGRIKYSLEELAWWLKPPVVLYNQSEIKFTNGSSIISQVTSDQTFRGRSLHLSLIDEYAHCSLEVQSSFLESFLPSLTAGGDQSTAKAIFISTPRSASGKYAELCFGAQAGENGFVYHKVDHEKIPYRSEAWRKDKIKQLGMAKYRQEYEGAFLSDSGTLINSIVLESIKTKDPVDVFGDLEIYVDSLSGRKIVMGVDSSEGISKDAHCIQLVDATTFEQVGEFTNNTMTQSHYAKTIIKIISMLFGKGTEEVYLAIERNGVSMGVIRLLENSEDDDLNKAIFINDVNEMGVATGKTGLTTTNKSKQEGCSQLKDLVESGRMKLNGASTVNELRFFVKRGASFAAEAGAKDDRAMALVIVCNALKQVMNYEETVYEALSEIDPDMGGDDCYDIYF